MEDKNILSSGIDTLNEIKEQVLELNGCKEKNNEYEQREAELEKLIEIKDKLIQEEINLTLKKRKEEMELTFDEQTDQIRARIKKIKSKKEKLKDSKMSERMKIETSDLYEANKKLKQNNKKVFKQNHVPAICNTKLYYALFSPGSLLDILTAFAAVLIAFLAIPCGIYYFLIPEKKMIYLAFIYFITIVVICGGYILINNLTKSKHKEEIAQGKRWRSEIRANKRKIKSIRNSIIKDKDESSYGLDKFNDEMKELNFSLEDCLRQKQEALVNFEKMTSVVISTEISARYQEEIDQLKKEYDEVHDKINHYTEKVKAMSLEMSNNYEAFIGKDYLTLDKLDELIQIMEHHEGTTISGAISMYDNRTTPQA